MEKKRSPYLEEAAAGEVLEIAREASPLLDLEKPAPAPAVEVEEKDQMLMEFKRKLISEEAGAPTFIFFPNSENGGDSEISHKLNRIIQELKYIEKNYSKFLALTAREKEIIALIVTSYQNHQISEKLFISIRTVEQHRKNINRKLETTSIPDICSFAYAFNLV